MKVSVRLSFLVVALLANLVQFGFTQTDLLEPVLTLGDFRKLGEEGVGRKVEFEATVTFADPIWNFVFVQDGENAVFVSGVDGQDLELGDRIRIVGVGESGDLETKIRAGQAIRIQSGEPPKPTLVELSKLNYGDYDARYLSTQGVVKRAVSGVGHTLLFCEESGVEFHVSLLGSRNIQELWELIGMRMEFVGALGLTIERGLEDKYSLSDRIRMFRVNSMKEPEVLSKGETGLPERIEENGASGTFLMAGQVTAAVDDFFVLTENQKATRIEFPKVHGFGHSNIARIAGRSTFDADNNPTLEALVVEALFSTRILNAGEFHSVKPADRLWAFVKVIGRPSNVVTNDGQIQFDVIRDGQKASVRLGRQVSTSAELIRNTQLLEVNGTVVDCDSSGNCKVVIPSSNHIILLEPRVPIWKYVAWTLIPIAGIFLVSFMWVKAQRNQAASQAKAISTINNRLVSTYQAIDDGLLAVDNSNRVLSVNSEFCKLVGRELKSSEIVAEETCADFLSRTKNPQAIHEIVFSNKTTDPDENGIEVEVVVPEPKIYDLRVSSIVADDEVKVGRLFVLRDRTRERQLQAELIHSNKIEAVGQLVGGIAHDFNNILTAVTANLSLLGMKPHLDNGMRERIVDAELAANRGTDLVRRLLTYSGKAELNPSPNSINSIVRELHRFARATFDARYEFSFDLDETEPFVQVDPVAIEQVILNLYLNARDAMPDGGRILTKTQIDTGSENPLVSIQISDNGPGISASNFDRIFEPFFTTKAGQAGTGLGLSTSKRLILEQKGDLECESSPENGTTFLIRIPAVDRPVEDQAKEFLPTLTIKQPAATEKKTVLVVDDEDSIRAICVLILEAQDFDVVTAANGEAALTCLRDLNQQVDMLLLDLTMPGISGMEVLEIAASEFPNLPVVLCSGYLGGVYDSLDRDCLTLPKPFSASELIGAVKNALATESPAAKSPK